MKRKTKKQKRNASKYNGKFFALVGLLVVVVSIIFCSGLWKSLQNRLDSQEVSALTNAGMMNNAIYDVVEPKQTGLKISYSYPEDKGIVTYSVHADIYSNGYHRNGYIIIRKITYSDPCLYLEYTINCSPVKYIRTIRNLELTEKRDTDEKFEPTVTRTVRLRDDKEVMEDFRTAEAMICASTKDLTCDFEVVSEDAVKEAGDKMRRK